MAKFAVAVALFALIAVAYGQLLAGPGLGLGAGLGRIGGLGLGGVNGGWGGAESYVARQQIHAPGWGWGNAGVLGGAGIGLGGIIG